jgi:hypothetical protein
MQKRTLAQSCLSCLDWRKFTRSPSLSNVWPNAERFALPYAFAGLATLVVITFLSSWVAFLPVVSLLFLLPVAHYQSERGLTWAVATIVAAPHALFVVVMFVTVGGNVALPAVVCALGLAAGVAHASYRQIEAVDGDVEMAELAAEQSWVLVDDNNNESVLEEFRRHSQSVKEKYGLQ